MTAPEATPPPRTDRAMDKPKPQQAGLFDQEPPPPILPQDARTAPERPLTAAAPGAAQDASFSALEGFIGAWGRE